MARGVSAAESNVTGSTSNCDEAADGKRTHVVNTPAPSVTATGERMSSPREEDSAGDRGDEVEDAVPCRSDRQERFCRQKFFAKERCRRREQELLFDSLCAGVDEANHESHGATLERRIPRHPCSISRDEIDEHIERRLIELRSKCVN